uniref:Uncharacterized protein n=1 Tax=Pipistrellus kuhlii TaxID=59472 RepID=A0A7J7RKF4_PIPKU|nr:hypothetical protein mPipKuh1_010534 [Pipistrellus kuhlii]
MRGHEQKGLRGAVGGVICQLPPTAVRPLILATEATSNLLEGMRNPRSSPTHVRTTLRSGGRTRPRTEHQVPDSRVPPAQHAQRASGTSAPPPSESVDSLAAGPSGRIGRTCPRPACCPSL